jgi:protein phosphatase
MTDRRSIERVLNTPKASLDAKAKNLVKLACDAGGKDNITVVLVEMITTGR